MTCVASHPERPLMCEADGTHADHLAWTPEGFVYWANEGYVPPPPKETKKRNTQAQGKFLEAAGKVAPEKRTSPVDAVAATAGRADGMRRVVDHADPAWKDLALETIRLVALDTPEFIVDHVWERGVTTGLEKPEVPQAIGPLFNEAERRGWIEHAGRTERSNMATRHKPYVVVWRSLTYQLAAPESAGEYVLRDFG